MCLALHQGRQRVQNCRKVALRSRQRAGRQGLRCQFYQRREECEGCDLRA